MVSVSSGLMRIRSATAGESQNKLQREYRTHSTWGRQQKNEAARRATRGSQTHKWEKPLVHNGLDAFAQAFLELRKLRQRRSVPAVSIHNYNWSGLWFSCASCRNSLQNVTRESNRFPREFRDPKFLTFAKDIEKQHLRKRTAGLSGLSSSPGTRCAFSNICCQ